MKKSNQNLLRIGQTVLVMVFFAFLFQNTAQASEITADKIIELVNQSRSKDELPPLF
jgi:hypothetical protein